MVCLAEMERQRKNRTIKVDTVVLEGLKKWAKTKGISVNKLLELHLFDEIKQRGFIAEDMELLGETRGGDQKSDRARSDKSDSENA